MAGDADFFLETYFFSATFKVSISKSQENSLNLILLLKPSINSRLLVGITILRHEYIQIQKTELIM